MHLLFVYICFWTKEKNNCSLCIELLSTQTVMENSKTENNTFFCRRIVALKHQMNVLFPAGNWYRAEAGFKECLPNWCLRGCCKQGIPGQILLYISIDHVQYTRGFCLRCRDQSWNIMEVTIKLILLNKGQKSQGCIAKIITSKEYYYSLSLWLWASSFGHKMGTFSVCLYEVKLSNPPHLMKFSALKPQPAGQVWESMFLNAINPQHKH